MSDGGELLAFLGRPELARLWREVRARLERLGRVGGEVRLIAPTEAERTAIANLLGLATLPRGEVRVPLARLDRVLLASRFRIDLTAAMARLGGPLRNLPAEQQRLQARRQVLWQEARAHRLLTRVPALSEWLDELAASGLLARLAGGEESEMLGRVLAVLSTVLARGTSPEPIRLAVVANEVLGSSHGLDPGQPVATLALSALTFLRGLRAPRSAAERRELWEQSGVIADDLSTHVLTLGLVPAGRGPLAETLAAFAACGEPMVLTLRQLGRGELRWPDRSRVFACENPAVVATAADRLGPSCPPLVCVAGTPNHAAWTLLGALCAQGGELLYHGDFDWPGIRIGNLLSRLPGFRPWRFGASDYRAAAGRTSPPSLEGPAVDAAWDPDLAPEMAQTGVPVEEEAVLDQLMADLAAGGVVS